MQKRATIIPNFNNKRIPEFFVMPNLFNFSGRQHEQKKLDISKYPRDKVILFQFPRGSRAPSHSPFTLKLETYLRMANIPYQVSETGMIF